VSKVVLDSSALLAFINRETGRDVVAALLDDAVINAVNVSEVAAKLAEVGFDAVEIRDGLEAIGVEVVSCDKELAYVGGLLRPATKPHGLSLGDRLCLALAQRLGAPVLTADRAWAGVRIGVEIRPIR